VHATAACESDELANRNVVNNVIASNVFVNVLSLIIVSFSLLLFFFLCASFLHHCSDWQGASPAPLWGGIGALDFAKQNL
jgi:hypothetical protein